MIKEFQYNIDCISYVITLILMLVKFLSLLGVLPTRLLEGITKKGVGISRRLFSLSQLILF
ncbi:hypothetical protein CD110_00980 [Staphylococcus casei]|nr:hypothetical protein CD110_00980 [Staphylococcus casei]